MTDTADRILAAVAASLAENGGPHARTVMTAAVLAHQQPELTACEAVEMSACEMWDEPGRSALAEAKRLLALAEKSAPFDEGEGSPPPELAELTRILRARRDAHLAKQGGANA